MRKLTKIIGVALIATGLMISVTGCADPNSGLAELQAENEKLEKELKDEKNKNEELQNQLAALTAAKNILDEKFKDLKDLTPEQIVKLKNAQEKYDALIANLTELSKDFDDGIIDGQEYSEELAGIIGELKSLADIISELSTGKANAENERDVLQKQLADLSASLDSIIKTVANTSLEDKIKAISDEIAKLNADLKKGSVDTTKYESEIAELKARVDELIAENEQLKEATVAKYVITFNKALWKNGEKHIIEITDKNVYFNDKEFKVGTENTLSLPASKYYIDEAGKISNNLSELGDKYHIIKGFCDIDGNEVTKVSNADMEILLKVSAPINNSSDKETDI